MFQAILRLIGLDVGFSSALATAGQASQTFAQKVNSSMFSAFTASTLVTKGLGMLKNAFEGAMHEAKQFTNLSLRLGIKPSEVMALSNYAKDSGVSLMVLGKAQQQLDKFVAGSETTKKYKDLKNTLGITAEEMKKFQQGGGVAMADLAKKMQLVNDETEQMEILTKIFGGRGAMQMKQVLEQSPEEIEAGYKSYAASDETIASANRMEGAVSNVSQMIKVAGFELLAAFEPISGVLALIAAGVMGIISAAVNGVKMVYQALIGSITSGLSYFSSAYQPAADAAWKKYYEAGNAIGKGMEAAGKLAMLGIDMIGASMTDNLKAIDRSYQGILITAERKAKIEQESARKEREYMEWRMNAQESIEKAEIDAAEDLDDLQKEYEGKKAEAIRNAHNDRQKAEFEDIKRAASFAQAQLTEQNNLLKPGALNISQNPELDQFGAPVDKWDVQNPNHPDVMIRKYNDEQLRLTSVRASIKIALKELEVLDEHGVQTEASKKAQQKFLNKGDTDFFTRGKYGIQAEDISLAGYKPRYMPTQGGGKRMRLAMNDEEWARSQLEEKEAFLAAVEKRREELRAIQGNSPEAIKKRKEIEAKRDVLERTAAARERDLVQAQLDYAQRELDAAKLYDEANGRKRTTAERKIAEDKQKKIAAQRQRLLSQEQQERALEQSEDELAAMDELHKLRKENPFAMHDVEIKKAQLEVDNAREDIQKLNKQKAEGIYVSPESITSARQKSVKAQQALKKAQFAKEDAIDSFFTAAGDSLQAVGGGGNIAAGPMQIALVIKDNVITMKEHLASIDNKIGGGNASSSSVAVFGPEESYSTRPPTSTTWYR